MIVARGRAPAIARAAIMVQSFGFDLSKYKFATPTTTINKMLIPITNFGFNDTDVAEFNTIYKHCIQQTKLGNYSPYIMTRSGGISIKRNVNFGPRWHLNAGKTFVEIILCDQFGRNFRFIIGHQKDKKDSMSGRQAFWEYKDMLIKHAINLEDLAISSEEGLKIKETIPSPRIELVAEPATTYQNAHHIDLNSAYNAGMMEAFPVLEPAIRELYNKRKLNPKFKDVLNMTQGFMQSSLCQYKYSHISKAGYVYTLRRLQELSDNLTKAGCKILAYNTDGIWYQGEMYHDQDEGKDIGQWKHDYENCLVRFKSKGCYEIMKPDGSYKPVFRGESSFEKIRPRSEWIWGDIFRGDVINYQFIEGLGVIKC